MKSEPLHKAIPLKTMDESKDIPCPVCNQPLEKKQGVHWNFYACYYCAKQGKRIYYSEEDLKNGVKEVERVKTRKGKGA